MKKLSFSLKDLRLRLGWSQSAMAQHLNCDLWTFRDWESSNKCPKDILNNKLIQLSSAVERNSRRTVNSSIAETTLNDMNLSQINLTAA